MATLETPSPEKKKRKSRYIRRDKAGMVLQDRDVEVLEAIWRGGRLTQKQIEVMFFGTYTACWRRLDKLHANHFVDRYFFNAAPGEVSPAFYGIARKGVAILQERKGHSISWYNSSKDVTDAYLRHMKVINDVWAVATKACQKLGFVLHDFHTEREVKADHVPIRTSKGQQKKVAVLPDAVFSVLAYNQIFWFCVEADRGTEIGETWKNKVRGYLAWRDNGGFEAQYNASRFRIITIVQTRYSGEKRLVNLKKATEEAGGRSLFWFTSAKHLDLEQPEAFFEALIWQVASETQPARLLKPPQPKGQ